MPGELSWRDGSKWVAEVDLGIWVTQSIIRKHAMSDKALEERAEMWSGACQGQKCSRGWEQECTQSTKLGAKVASSNGRQCLHAAQQQQTSHDAQGQNRRLQITENTSTADFF